MKPARPAALVAGLFCIGCALAQPAPSDSRARAAFEPHPGATLPASLAFRDESGARVELADYYGSAPIVLVFAWYGCTALCPTVVESLARALEQSGTTPGKGYQVIVASIDPLDSPAAAMRMKQGHLTSVTTHDEAQAWHLLTGNERSIANASRAATSVSPASVRRTASIASAGSCERFASVSLCTRLPSRTLRRTNVETYSRSP